MDSAINEILVMFATVSPLVSSLVAITVIVLGLVVVRPINNVAAIIFAGAGVAQLMGLGLVQILWFLDPKIGDIKTLFMYDDIRSLINVFSELFLCAGVLFGSMKLAQTNVQRAAQW